MTVRLFCMLLFYSFLGWGQTEPNSYRTVVVEFQKLYNEEAYDQLFDLYSREMKEAQPLEKAHHFLRDLKNVGGRIRQSEFISSDSEIANYKLTFEKGIYDLKIALNRSNEIAGYHIKFSAPIENIQKSTTPLQLPFKEEWTVTWGGTTDETNGAHRTVAAQQGAFDLLITDTKGKSFLGNGTSNKDYYVFGKEIIAPCDAEVVVAVDGIDDNIPGQFNPLHVYGNEIILRTDQNEYVVFAHLKQHSIQVKMGQKVKKGELLGLCGNSGNSSEPHLHFHVQDRQNTNDAIGLQAFFQNIRVDQKLHKQYSPIKGDKIQN